MGVLVSVTILWMAAIVAVFLFFTLGPPARRLSEIGRAIEEELEEKRRAAVSVRDETSTQLMASGRSLDEIISHYQESRRQVLPRSSDHRWGEKELQRWRQQESAERGRSIRNRNMYGMVLWLLALSLLFGIGIWSYYCQIQSKVRPILHSTNAFHTP